MERVLPAVAVILAAVFTGSALAVGLKERFHSARARGAGMTGLHTMHFDSAVRPSREIRRAMSTHLNGFWKVVGNETGAITVGSFKGRSIEEMLRDPRPIAGGDGTEDLTELKGQLKAKLTEAKTLAEEVEKKHAGVFSGEQKTTIKAILEDAKGLKDQIKALEGDAALRKEIDALGDAIALIDGGTKEKPSSFGGIQTVKSIGEVFVESDEYKAFMAQFPGGKIPDGAKGLHSAPVGVKSLFGHKDIVTGADPESGGAFVQTDYTGILDLLGRAPRALRDLISTRRTTSDTVEFVRQLTRVNAAAPTPEATTADAAPDPDNDNTAGVKPQGGFTFEKVTATVKTIAEWVPATKRALSDAAQLMGLINDELMEDLKEAEEDQMINGDDTGENLEGILEVDGTQPQGFDTDLFVTTRKAITLCQTVGRANPTAFLLNPEDDERFDLERDGEERFYGNGPFSVGPSTLWGRPRVVSEAVPPGVGICGDFKKAVFWDREEASISITDSHADFFVRNLIAVLAEERGAFGVVRPAAFVICDLTA